MHYTETYKRVPWQRMRKVWIGQPYYHKESCLKSIDVQSPVAAYTLWQSSANALPVCCHALPVALPVF